MIRRVGRRPSFIRRTANVLMSSPRLHCTSCRVDMERKCSRWRRFARGGDNCFENHVFLLHLLQNGNFPCSWSARLSTHLFRPIYNQFQENILRKTTKCVVCTLHKFYLFSLNKPKFLSFNITINCVYVPNWVENLLTDKQFEMISYRVM